MDIIFKSIALTVIAVILQSCVKSAGQKNALLDNDDRCLTDEIHIVSSDDSLVNVTWRYTTDGGTAPDIDMELKYQTCDGVIVKESRVLLKMIHPDEDYSQREVQRIVSMQTEFDPKTYFFFLRGKTDSNVYEYDLVAFRIDGDSLCPANVFLVGNMPTAHIKLNTTNIDFASLQQ